MSFARTDPGARPPEVGAPPGGAPSVLFYDGHCGLCHRAVRFVLARDPEGEHFEFSPLQGETVGRLLDAEQRRDLPDAIVVLGRDGRLRVRSSAVLYILEELGRGWRLLARLARLVPRPVRDAMYDAVAGARHRLFARPDRACPLVPPEQRRRFLP